MNRIANQIKNRLSLRAPQSISLDILSILADKLDLKKGADLTIELAKVKALYPTCTDFERNFPSMCFALATGVGKTRLMGAFIAYLYLEKGIKNFFVLAPNLTIYNKLIDDIENVSNPKYVFQGIGEFVHSHLCRAHVAGDRAPHAALAESATPLWRSGAAIGRVCRFALDAASVADGSRDLHQPTGRVADGSVLSADALLLRPVSYG